MQMSILIILLAETAKPDKNCQKTSNQCWFGASGSLHTWWPGARHQIWWAARGEAVCQSSYMCCIFLWPIGQTQNMRCSCMLIASDSYLCHFAELHSWYHQLLISSVQGWLWGCNEEVWHKWVKFYLTTMPNSQLTYLPNSWVTDLSCSCHDTCANAEVNALTAFVLACVVITCTPNLRCRPHSIGS